MKNSVLGELVFNTGWKTQIELTLFEKSYYVTVKATAYYEKDGLTVEQEDAFSDFYQNKDKYLKMAEKLLLDLDNNSASERFTPQTLLFQRDGGYALLLDDKDDEDDGIAVCIKPQMEIVLQDEYL